MIVREKTYVVKVSEGGSETHFITTWWARKEKRNPTVELNARRSNNSSTLKNTLLRDLNNVAVRSRCTAEVNAGFLPYLICN